MSMINDALRRASSAAKSGPGAPPLSPGFAPVPPLPSASSGTMPLPPPPLPGDDAAFPPPPSFGDRGNDLPEPPSTTDPARKKKSLLPLLLILFLVFGAAGGAGYFSWKKKKPADQVREQIKPEVAKLKDPTVEKAPKKVIAPPTPRPPAVVPALVAPITPAPAPVAAVPVRFPPLRLQSIFYRPEDPSVIINGKTLFIDDQINGVVVADIRSSSVTLVLSGQTNILTLR